MKKNKAKKPARLNRSGGVHLIGICGAGMSALAVLLKESGWRVSGSDEGVFEPIVSYLHKNKISFHKTHRPENIPAGTNLVVVGKHTGLAVEDNSETREAIKRKIPIKSLPEMLALLSEGTENIVVTGSFGKSTLTALITWCLTEARKDPSYFIGALPLNLKNSSHLGKGREFVLEGDEYPSANWDKSSKFLHYKPTSVLLISAEHDHVNIFPTEKSYITTYKKLVSKIPKQGLLVYSLNGKNNKEIAKDASSKHLRYSVDDKKADWYAQNIKYKAVTTFDLMRKGKKVARIETILLGKHNIENIVGAGALLLENKKLSPALFARAVKNFKGISRRIELKNPKGKIPVYDGFGSSYEKARAIFDALRLHFPEKRLIAVFEPHAFSWRNKKFLPWYKNIFQGVDEVILLPATSRGKKGPGEISTEEIWATAKKHFPVHTAKGEKEALKILKEIVRDGDVIALVSSGPMFGLTESVPKLF
ncbi:MAG: Mur ligase family protein [Candidatus Paceibacterota bacterium]|jgi:UDP-N-acetylmuramate: L-alanyl-gamma-D-glutamyl-meso-diaminopimelate ligase